VARTLLIRRHRRLIRPDEVRIPILDEHDSSPTGIRWQGRPVTIPSVARTAG
jgi:hypothetical protein